MVRTRLPGEPVLLRDVYRSRVRSVVPMLVVEATTDRVVLLFQQGTPFRLPVDPDGRLTKDVAGFDRLTELRWVTSSELVIASARSGERPFTEGWERWQPDESWSIPSPPAAVSRPRPMIPRRDGSPPA